MHVDSLIAKHLVFEGFFTIFYIYNIMDKCL